MVSASLLERRVDTGRSELDDISRLEVVVIIRRVLSDGRRAARRVVKSETGVEAGMGRESVFGRLRPGKEVKNTLMVLSAIPAVIYDTLGDFTVVCADVLESENDWKNKSVGLSRCR